MTGELANTYRRVRPACVAIALADEDNKHIRFRIFGSGVCIDSSGIVVTARHVVTEYYRIFEEQAIPQRPEEVSKDFTPATPRFLIVFFRRAKTKFEAFYVRPGFMMHLLEKTDPNADVAVIRIPKPTDGFWPSVPLAALTRRLQEGEEVATVGYPLCFNPIGLSWPSLSKGIVSMVEGQFKKGGLITVDVRLDLTVNPGNSGGPVFDPVTGEVLGIVRAEGVREPPEVPKELRDRFLIPSGVAHCVPHTTIQWFLEDFRAKEQQKPKPGIHAT